MWQNRTTNIVRIAGAAMLASLAQLCLIADPDQAAAAAAEPAPALQPAIDLVALDGDITVETDAALRALDSFSLDVVVQFSSLADGHILSLKERWDQDGFYLQLYRNQLVLGFGHHGTMTQAVSPPDLIEPGRWYRISAIKDRAVARLFIDGRMVADHAVAAAVIDSTADLKLGEGGYNIRAQLRGFRLWREPLTPDQVAGIGQADDQPDLPKPLIDYDFDEGQGPRLANRAGDRYGAKIQGKAADFGWTGRSGADLVVAPAAPGPRSAALKLAPSGRRLIMDDLALAEPTADLTLRMTVRLNPRRTGAIATLSDAAGSQLSLKQSTDVISFEVDRGARRQRIVAPQGLIEPGRWVTLTARQRAGTASLFVNGLRVASYATRRPLAFRKLRLALGDGPDATAFELAELSIWRRALSEQEIVLPVDLAQPPVDPDLLMQYGPWDRPEPSATIRDRGSQRHDALLLGSGEAWAEFGPAEGATRSFSATKARFDQLAADTPPAKRIQGSKRPSGKTRMTLATEPFELALGSGQVLPLPRSADTLIVDDPNIAKAEIVSPREVYVFGAKLGRTKVIALDQQHRAIVALQIRVLSDEAAANEALDKVDGGADDRFVDIAGRLKLDGTAKDVGEAIELAELGEHGVIAGGPSRNATVIEGAQQVNIRVRFAEVSRSDVARLGINWSSIISPGDFVGGVVSGDLFLGNSLLDASGAAFGGVNRGDLDVNLLLEALQREGALNLLAEPNLTVLNGEEARFLAGGELPIPVPQDSNGTIIVQFRPFGVSLNFRPILLDEQRISLHVQSEVSDISTEGAVQFSNVLIPAFNVRRAETTLEMASGQTFAVGGLFKRTTTRNIDSFPGLASIPVLGALFRSTRYNRSETELVILITPYLVDPVAEQRPLAAPGQAPTKSGVLGLGQPPDTGFTFR